MANTLWPTTNIYTGKNATSGNYDINSLSGYDLSNLMTSDENGLPFSVSSNTAEQNTNQTGMSKSALSGMGSVIAPLVGLGVSLFSSNNKAASVPESYFQPTPIDVSDMSGLGAYMKSITDQQNVRRQNTMNKIDEQMQDRGLFGSGLHTQAVTQAEQDLQRTETQEQSKMAQEWYQQKFNMAMEKAKQSDAFKSMLLQYKMAQEQNDQARKDALSASIGQALGSIALML